MKLLLLITTIALSCVFAIGQETKSEQQFNLRDCDECSCPGAHPSRWDVIYGKAVSIVDSDTIVVEAFKVSDYDSVTENNKKLFTIDLIGIDTTGNETEVLTYLQKNILNHRVNVSVKWKTGLDLQNSGVVQEIGENSVVAVNEYLLEKGIVTYKKIDDSLDDEGVTDCEFKVLERKAKQAELGIWAK